jgi:hypothetical protein
MMEAIGASAFLAAIDGRHDGNLVDVVLAELRQFL